MHVAPQFCYPGHSCLDPTCTGAPGTHAPGPPNRTGSDPAVDDGDWDGQSPAYASSTPGSPPSLDPFAKGADLSELARQMRVAAASKPNEGEDQGMRVMTAILRGAENDVEISHEDMVEANVLKLFALLHYKFKEMILPNGAVRKEEECTLLCYLWLIAILASELHVVCQCVAF